jgi:hypothetical protein
VNVHHTDEAVAIVYEMAAAAGAENFSAIFFERDVAWSGWHFLAHDVGGAEASKSLPDGHLSDALLRGIQKEPADERSPDTGSKATVKNR